MQNDNICHTIFFSGSKKFIAWVFFSESSLIRIYHSLKLSPKIKVIGTLAGVWIQYNQKLFMN